jgi:serine/threonine protein kinase
LVNQFTSDKRADILAFGCVLYEMLTGRVAFQGEDVREILASVIKADVNLDRPFLFGHFWPMTRASDFLPGK